MAFTAEFFFPALSQQNGKWDRCIELFPECVLVVLQSAVTPPGHRSVGRRDNIILVAKICVKCVFFTHFTHFTGGGSYVSVLCRAVSSLGPDLGWRQRRRTTPLQSTGHPPAGPQPQQLRTPQEAPPVLLLKLPVWNRSQAQTSPGHLKSP